MHGQTGRFDQVDESESQYHCVCAGILTHTILDNTSPAFELLVIVSTLLTSLDIRGLKMLCSFLTKNWKSLKLQLTWCQIFRHCYTGPELWSHICMSEILIIGSFFPLQTLRLDNNPWSCDCAMNHSLHWLQKPKSRWFHDLVRSNPLVCAT